MRLFVLCCTRAARLLCTIPLCLTKVPAFDLVCSCTSQVRTTCAPRVHGPHVREGGGGTRGGVAYNGGAVAYNHVVVCLYAAVSNASLCDALD